MSLDELKLLARLEELDAYTHRVVMQFPKFERHVLSAEIRGCMAACLRLTVRAAKRYHKKTTLEDLDIELAFLRILVRKEDDDRIGGKTVRYGNIRPAVAIEIG